MAEASGLLVQQHPTRRSKWERGLVGVSSEAADFKALLRRRVRRIAPSLPTVRHSFLPWALFPSKVIRAPRRSGRARPIEEPPRSSRSATAADPRVHSSVTASRHSRTGNRDPSASFPPPPGRSRLWGAAGGPKPSPATAPFKREGETPDGASWRVPQPKLGWSPGQCPRSLSGTRSREVRSAMPPTIRLPPEGDALPAGSPAGQIHRPSWGS